MSLPSSAELACAALLGASTIKALQAAKDLASEPRRPKRARDDKALHDYVRQAASAIPAPLPTPQMRIGIFAVVQGRHELIGVQSLPCPRAAVLARLNDIYDESGLALEARLID